MSGSKLFAQCLITSRKSLFSFSSLSIRTYTVPNRLFSVSSTRNMKFVQFTSKDNPSEIRVGYVEGNNVVDINKANPKISSALLEILRNNQVEEVKKLKQTNPATIPLSSVNLKAPIHGVDKVLCIGLNYMDHCKEQNLTPPEVPMIFSKFASTIIGPSDAVKLRTDVCKSVDYEIEMTVVVGRQASNVKAVDAKNYIFGYTIAQDICDRDWQNKNGGQLLLGKKVDWEIELCVVIGKQASDVKTSDVTDYILGYTVAQDISARDWQKQKNGGQFLLGKSMDTFCPIGPWIVTADEIGNAEALNVKCSVNGVVKQESNTNQLVHKIADVIARISSVMTLYPGDILLTGTPGGVGLYRDPPEFLKPGDVIHSEIEKIGVLKTRVEQYKN